MPQDTVAGLIPCLQMRSRGVTTLAAITFASGILLSIDESTSDKKRGERLSTPKSGDDYLI